MRLGKYLTESMKEIQITNLDVDYKHKSGTGNKYLLKVPCCYNCKDSTYGTVPGSFKNRLICQSQKVEAIAEKKEGIKFNAAQYTIEVDDEFVCKFFRKGRTF